MGTLKSVVNEIMKRDKKAHIFVTTKIGGI